MQEYEIIYSDTLTTTARNETAPALLSGFQPAFRHRLSGESHLAQIEPGIPATTYAFAGLPNEWIVERDEHGIALALHPDVVPGYWHDARFIAFDELIALPLDS